MRPFGAAGPVYDVRPSFVLEGRSTSTTGARAGGLGEGAFLLRRAEPNIRGPWVKGQRSTEKWVAEKETKV